MKKSYIHEFHKIEPKKLKRREGGVASARLLPERRFRVFGCDLHAASIEHSRFHALNVGVTNEQSVQKALILLRVKLTHLGQL